MKSLDLIPDLEKLPGDHRHRSFRETIGDLRAGESTLMAGEAVAAASFSLWGIWDKINVPDSLIQAYEAQYPGEAAKQSLLENWQEVQARGADAANGFISGLKGKLAEIRAAEMLEQEGYSDVNIARSSNQSTWDISAVNEVGEPVFFQVKSGAEGYASDVASDMAETEVEFLVSSEIAAKIIGSDPGYADRLTDIGPDYELVVDVQDGLETLADNQGLDIPDSIGEAIPYVGGVIVAGRLINTALKSEGEFKDVDRTTKNRIHVLRTLTMMSRFGITTVLTSAGAAGGSTLGFGLPGAIVAGHPLQEQATDRSCWTGVPRACG
ncbi:MAG: hypothetical protein OXN89_26105 [Bryobacterales bacterium]|nr:hypothetical protein [Bryobacterales bacterium]